ncbi:MAG: hypothetical protein ACXU8O_02330, partial [Asticcacaulis sp.]
MTFPQSSPSALSTDTVLLDYGLRAQGRMLPYVFCFFGLGLPIFLWVAQLSVSPLWLGGYLSLLT